MAHSLKEYDSVVCEMEYSGVVASWKYLKKQI